MDERTLLGLGLYWDCRTSDIGTADIDPVPGESFPRSGSMLSRPMFLDACASGPGRSLPESGGIPDGPGSADAFGSGFVKTLPKLWRGVVGKGGLEHH